MDPVLMQTLLTELVRFEIAAFEQGRAMSGPRSLLQAELASKREIAQQETLREAIFLRDWNVARAPLAFVATRLGVDLPDTMEAWNTLAIEATRVLINISEERARRDRGDYDGPSVFFRHASNLDLPHSIPTSKAAKSTTSPAGFASTQQERCEGETISTLSAETGVPSQSDPLPMTPQSNFDIADQSVNASQPVQEEIAKPKLGAPANDPVSVDSSIASETSKTGPLLLADAFDQYISRKKAGYTDEFGSEEVPNPATGRAWAISSENGLLVGKRLWVNLLGNRPYCEIPDQDVREAKALMRRLPETHGKSCSETRDLRRLVEETDAKEARDIENAIAEATRAGGSPAKIEQAKLNARIPRIRVETILKHTRALNRPGKMMVKLGELQVSPFTKHMLSASSLAAMRKQEKKRDRRPWDDRIYQLFGTPVFQGETDEVGDPLFWTPLMSLLGGARQEELLQLSPNDFESSGGIHYYRLTNGEGQSIKSESGHRLIPVHPELVRLGLVQLVARRLKDGEPRLFPNLQRGKNKETYSELFTKEFTKYRQANKVYWRGLDFHALRTTFHHLLMDNLVPGYVKRRILGHRPLDEGELSYSQGGISIATLNGVIEAVAFDLSMVQSPFGEHCGRHEDGSTNSTLRLVR
jgi:hypothetical protein